MIFNQQLNTAKVNYSSVWISIEVSATEDDPLFQGNHESFESHDDNRSVERTETEISRRVHVKRIVHQDRRKCKTIPAF